MPRLLFNIVPIEAKQQWYLMVTMRRFKLKFSALKLAITHGDHLVCKEGEQSPKLKIEVNHASFC